jgi:hypothetical protein
LVRKLLLFHPEEELSDAQMEEFGENNLSQCRILLIQIYQDLLMYQHDAFAHQLFLYIKQQLATSEGNNGSSSSGLSLANDESAQNLVGRTSIRDKFMKTFTKM